MKKLICILAITSIQQLCFGDDWILINPIWTSSVQFVSNDVGWSDLWRTKDGGITWTNTYPEEFESTDPNIPGSKELNIMDVEPVTENLAYFMCHQFSNWESRMTALYETQNCGDKWYREFYNDEIDSSPICAQVFFLNETYGWFALNGYSQRPECELYITRDGGEKWELATSTFVSGIRIYSYLQFIDQSTGWAIDTDSFLIKTEDGGITWNTINNNSSPPQKWHDLMFIDNERGFVINESNLLMTTYDGGISWLTLDTGEIQNLNSIFPITSYSIWAAGDNGIFQSSDGGSIWRQSSDLFVTDIFFLSQELGWTSGPSGLYKYISGLGFNPPRLIDPVDYKIGIGTSAWFSWSSVESATSYDIQIDSDRDFSSPLVDASYVNDARYFVKDMQYSHTYHWRVRSRDGSDVSSWSESRQFTTMAEPAVHINYPNQYVLYYIEPGDQHYIDREYTIHTIPADLQNLLWLKTANDDKNNSSASFISFTLDKPATVYIAYDERGTSVPDWMSSEYTLTNYVIEDNGLGKGKYYVWKKSYDRGTHDLGGNMAAGAAGAKSNYLVLFDITSFYSISGFVRYFSEDKPVANVNISPSKGAQKLTDQDGAYIFDDLEPGTDYVVTPSKLKEEDQDDLTITSQDAYETAQLAIGNRTPSSYQSTIADVDGDDQILMWDASLIARYSAGIQLPDSIKIGEWNFDSQQRSYPNLQQSYENQDYSAYVIGDVDGSWQMPTSAQLTKGSPYYYLVDSSRVHLSIPITDVGKLTSFDLIMTFEPDKFAYIGMESPGDGWQIIENLNSGSIKVAAFAGNEQTKSLENLIASFKILRELSQEIISVDRYLLNGQPQSSFMADVSISDRKQEPQEFMLFSNYPNPFNSMTTIRYSLPWEQPEFVTIDIYDINGSFVRNLFSGAQTAGVHKIKWDGKDSGGMELSSGLYFCNIRANGETQKSKIMLTK